MEEKKLDLNSIIGFVLIFGILLYMLWKNQPSPEQLEAQEKEKKESVKKQQEESQKDTIDYKAAEALNANVVTDSAHQEVLKSKLGAFAYSALHNSAANKQTKVESDLFELVFNSIGGYLSEVRLKKFVSYNQQPIYLIKNNNASFNINFGTNDNRTFNTKDLVFEPTVTKNGDVTVVSMKLKTSSTNFIEYRYEIKEGDYMIKFKIHSQGLQNVFNSSQDITLDWQLKSYRLAKSVSYDNRYTELIYEYEGGKDDYLGQGENATDNAKDVTYVAFKQHFFSSILLSDNALKTAQFGSKNLVKDEAIDSVFTKAFQAKLGLPLKGGELNESMDWYYGPTDYKILNAYNRNLDEVVPLGWGIFGWINRYLFIPLFTFLSSFLPYGIAIITMTILIKLLMSFVQYKQFLSQAKLKILKPELDAIREKYKDNKMKAQQEALALQTKAGASPMAGCLPALIQLPVFYALFQFFPSAFDLRQKSFLWADDLSSYDAIAKLPFNIPFYGDHISLFPILASIAIYFYMRLTTSDQIMSQPQQEGMPDMGAIMKYMMYFSPIMMLFFFNNYASGLSLYYFVSNLISIGIILVIKHYILDENKIHAQIQENKKKPVKENRFQKKMKEMMEEAEKQKNARKK